jgi:hypothetical protein
VVPLGLIRLPSALDRTGFGRRLAAAERRVRAGKPPSHLEVPNWALDDVRPCISYLTDYANSGVAHDPGSGVSVSAEQIISPEALAYEAWQLAVTYRSALSKRLGAGNEFLQKCNGLYRRAEELNGSFAGTTAELAWLLKSSAITEAMCACRQYAAFCAFKAATQVIATDVVRIMSEILGAQRFEVCGNHSTSAEAHA